MPQVVAWNSAVEQFEEFRTEVSEVAKACSEYLSGVAKVTAGQGELSEALLRMAQSPAPPGFQGSGEAEQAAEEDDDDETKKELLPWEEDASAFLPDAEHFQDVCKVSCGGAWGWFAVFRVIMESAPVWASC